MRTRMLTCVCVCVPPLIVIDCADHVTDGDILIHSGDFSRRGKAHNIHEAIEEFNAFLVTLPHAHKIVIAGNHEIAFNGMSKSEIQALLPHCVYLEDSSVNIMGLEFYGTPWTSSYRMGFSASHEELEQHWAAIPSTTDMLITHLPPRCILDLAACKHTNDDPVASGTNDEDDDDDVDDDDDGDGDGDDDGDDPTSTSDASSLEFAGNQAPAASTSTTSTTPAGALVKTTRRFKKGLRKGLRKMRGSSSATCSQCGSSHVGFRHWGSESLRMHVLERVRPLVHMFGHVHECNGVALDGGTASLAAGCDRGVAGAGGGLDVLFSNAAMELYPRPVLIDVLFLPQSLNSTAQHPLPIASPRTSTDQIDHTTASLTLSGSRM
jgi:predicted phosphohydrolase